MEPRRQVYYEDYFDPALEIIDDEGVMAAKLAASREAFVKAGFSDTESDDLVASGYCVLGGDLVIDRFYGGALSFADHRSRIPMAVFRDYLGSPADPAPVFVATQPSDIARIVDDLGRGTPESLLFRGQTRHYDLGRRIPNPAFTAAGLGESSLLPSLWRRVLGGRRNVFHQFRDLTMMEWSAIIYDTFNLLGLVDSEIEDGRKLGLPFARRESEQSTTFHEIRQEFINTFGMGGKPIFQTLLQHYGLYSPVLDLTSDLDVALFFATHKFGRVAGKNTYTFVGDNNRAAVIYVLRDSPRDTLAFERGKLLEALDPQRPKRQGCVVLPTDPFCMNLPADFLQGIITFDFDLPTPGLHTVASLFPGDAEDRFFASVKKNLHGAVRDAVTNLIRRQDCDARAALWGRCRVVANCPKQPAPTRGDTAAPARPPAIRGRHAGA